MAVFSHWGREVAGMFWALWEIWFRRYCAKFYCFESWTSFPLGRRNWNVRHTDALKVGVELQALWQVSPILTDLLEAQASPIALSEPSRPHPSASWVLGQAWAHVLGKALLKVTLDHQTLTSCLHRLSLSLRFSPSLFCSTACLASPGATGLLRHHFVLASPPAPAMMQSLISVTNPYYLLLIGVPSSSQILNDAGSLSQKRWKTEQFTTL